MTDEAILAAWEEFKAAHIDLDQLDDEFFGTEDPEEIAIWDRVDAAEQIIFATPATTARGIQCKLLVALYHQTSLRTDSQALLAGCYDALQEKAQGMDWPIRMVFSAIRSIEEMEA